MKKATLLSLLLFTHFVFAQEKMITATGNINFEASVPLFEDVKADNRKATCTLNTETGEITSSIQIKDFEFKKALMKKHFNENYIESDRYPNAVFKGKIENFDLKNIDSESKKFSLNGTLKLHGKSKK